jgi:hypothetical protein
VSAQPAPASPGLTIHRQASLEAPHSTHALEPWPPSAEKLARAAERVSLHETVTSDNSANGPLDLACGNRLLRHISTSTGPHPSIISANRFATKGTPPRCIAHDKAT